MAARRNGSIHGFDAINHRLTIGRVNIAGPLPPHGVLLCIKWGAEKEWEGIEAKGLPGRNMACLQKAIHR